MSPRQWAVSQHVQRKKGKWYSKMLVIKLIVVGCPCVMDSIPEKSKQSHQKQFLLISQLR